MHEEKANSLSEQIARHISEQIIRGELVEGERIQELRIASELDVSRGSVREALLLLERTQLIEIYPRRGAIVSEMSALQVRALFEMCCLLLGQIVQRMAETWRPHEAERVQLLLEQLEAETRQGHTEKFYDLIFQGLAQQQELRELVLSQELMQEQARHQKDSRESQLLYLEHPTQLEFYSQVCSFNI